MGCNPRASLSRLAMRPAPVCRRGMPRMSALRQPLHSAWARGRWPGNAHAGTRSTGSKAALSWMPRC